MCFTSAHKHVCVCLPWNMMSCPGSHILLDLALCSGSDRDISVRSSQSFLGQTCSTVWPSLAPPLSDWACISAKRSWGCSGSPACSLIPVPSLLLELWYSAPAQSAWSSTEPSAPKLTLEGTNPKAWGRHKITLPERSPQGLGSAWKPLVSSSSRGRPLSYIAADDPNFWGTVIPKKSSPAVLLVDFLKEVQSTELCQDYAQEWCWSPAWESTSIYHPQVDSDKTLQASSQMSMSSENF